MTVELIHGDALDALRGLPDASVDALITDPPGAIHFMSKSWDHNRGGRQQWVAWLAEVLSECRRVMKPGAYALVWALPRTSHWTGCAIEDSGLIVRDCITHLFGSGFPKSLDVSKALDKRRDWAALRRFQIEVKMARTALGISQSEAARRCGLIAPNESLCGGGFMWFETGMRLPTRVQYPAMKAALGLPDECDEAFSEAEREVLALKTYDRTEAGTWAAQVRSGMFQPGAREVDITAPATDLARQWDGWGTSLKPASEHWYLAQKPLDGTYAANVAKWNCGALAIDKCRVEGAPRATHGDRNVTGSQAAKVAYHPYGEGYTSELPAGRWPPNTLLSHSPDCRLVGTRRVKGISGGTGNHAGNVYGKRSNEGQPVKDYADPDGLELVEAWECARDPSGAYLCPVALLDAQAGERKSGGYPPAGGQRSRIATYGKPNERGDQRFGASDGGASRFFPTFAWSDADDLTRYLPHPYADSVVQCDENRQTTGGDEWVKRDRSQSTRAESATPPRRATTESPSGTANEAAPSWFTSLNGSGTTVPSQTATKSTTRTGTSRTTILETSSSSTTFPTSDCTADASCETASGGSPVASAANSSPSPLSTGISAERDTRSMDAADPATLARSLPINSGGEPRFVYIAKASRAERRAGLPPEMAASHPTVKPLALVRWLVRLITPPGGTVLDCFAGSGTTGVAAIAEGVNAILIEKDDEGEYIPIIRARLAHAERQAERAQLALPLLVGD